MPPDQAALIDDPAAEHGVLALELAQQPEHRGGLELMLPSATREFSQRAVDADDGHRLILDPGQCQNSSTSSSPQTKPRRAGPRFRLRPGSARRPKGRRSDGQLSAGGGQKAEVSIRLDRTPAISPTRQAGAGQLLLLSAKTTARSVCFMVGDGGSRGSPALALVISSTATARSGTIVERD